MGKRSRRRREDDDPTERPDAVSELLGPDPATPVGEDGVTAEGAGAGAGNGAGDGRQPDATSDADRAAAPKGRHPAPDGRLRDVALLVEEADYLGHLMRWILLTGEVPRAQDWLKREDWPHPDYVIDVFGSWERFLVAAGVPTSPLLARLREADAAQRDLAAREKQQVKEAGRADDLRRQVDTAKRRREAAEAERGEHLARAERAERAVGAADARAAAAEARLAERREAAQAAAPTETAADERVAALEDELESVRAHREELLRQVEEGREAAERDQRAIGRLSALLAEAGDRDADGPSAADADPPGTVREAVDRAAAVAQHLVFTDRARGSADDSPYRRPQEILDTLVTLDELAGRFAAGDMGMSLVQAATEAGLTYKQAISEITRSRHPHDYTVTWEGHKLDLGPHVALGSGSGAGFIARIYLHLADGSGDVPRGVYVGHVGRHLPDSTT